MGIRRYNKLVRDKIPQIIEEGGGQPEFYQADPNAYKTMLIYKLQEETSEFTINPSLEELADILEVVEALTKANGWDMMDLAKMKKEKKLHRGAFQERFVLTQVKEDD